MDRKLDGLWFMKLVVHVQAADVTEEIEEVDEGESREDIDDLMAQLNALGK